MIKVPMDDEGKGHFSRHPGWRYPCALAHRCAPLSEISALLPSRPTPQSRPAQGQPSAKIGKYHGQAGGHTRCLHLHDTGTFAILRIPVTSKSRSMGLRSLNNLYRTFSPRRNVCFLPELKSDKPSFGHLYKPARPASAAAYRLGWLPQPRHFTDQVSRDVP